MLVLAACVACGLAAAVPAQATFHLIKVRQVYAGGGNGDADYVELQMSSGGQTVVGNRLVQVYNGTGGLAEAFAIPGNVANGINQATILIGDSAVQSTFGVAPDFVDSNLMVDLLAISGAVCWPAGSPPDCVAWGGFTPQGGFPDTAAAGPGKNFPSAITGGVALTRKINRGCPTLLERSLDDRGPSSTDFALTAPSPRNNSSPITEKFCGPGGGANGAPNTKIKKRPKNRSDDASPTYKFKSTEPNSTFKCKLDRKKFRKCKSRKTYHGVDPGKHRFKVKAIDADGNADKTPAKDKFKVLP
jgi:hypothetical protein